MKKILVFSIILLSSRILPMDRFQAFFCRCCCCFADTPSKKPLKDSTSNYKKVDLSRTLSQESSTLVAETNESTLSVSTTLEATQPSLDSSLRVVSKKINSHPSLESINDGFSVRKNKIEKVLPDRLKASSNSGFSVSPCQT